jgi:hypothetical protein
LMAHLECKRGRRDFASLQSLGDSYREI